MYVFFSNITLLISLVYNYTRKICIDIVQSNHTRVIFSNLIFYEHIEAETIWTAEIPDSGFPTHCLVWKLLCFDSNVTEINSQRSI